MIAIQSSDKRSSKMMRKKKKTPVRLWDKEIAQQTQALGPFPEVLHPSHKYQSTPPHSL